MTEREKMLSGQLYCADEPELNAARHRADLLCRQLNALPMAETELRMEVLRQLLGKVGKNAPSILSFAVTMAATSRWARTSLPTTTASSWTAPR